MTPPAARVRYSGGDFSTHFAAIQDRLQAEYGADFDDFAITGAGVALMDLVAFALDGLSFSVDQRATNLYASTARVRRLVHLLCRQLGYKPLPAVASTVDLEVRVLDTLSSTLSLSAGTALRGPEGLVFELAQALVVTPPESAGAATKTAAAYEGTTVSETFVADGTPNQRYFLRRLEASRFVARGTVRVKVDGVSYAEQPYLRVGMTTAYEIDCADDPPVLRFGDGSLGSIPASGASIVVTYVSTAGRAGVVSRGAITDFAAPVVVGGVTVRTSVTNPRASVGGDDPEPLNAAAANAAAFVKAGAAAVTGPDYLSIAGSFADPAGGRVAVAQATLVRSVEDDAVMAAARSAVLTVFDAAVVAVTAALAGARTDASDLGTSLANIQARLVDAATTLASTTASLAASATAVRTVRGQASELSTTAAAAAAAVASVQATVAGIAEASSNQLTSSTKTALLLAIANAASLLSTASTTASAAASAADTAATSVQSARDTLVATVGTSVSPSVSGTAIARAAYWRAAASTSVAALVVRTNEIEDAVIDPSGTWRAGLAAAMDDISAYVDDILADEARSNVVQLPVLSVDAAGFYVAPPVALVRSLQSRLESCCETTQVPIVTSGAGQLVRAVVYVRIRARGDVPVGATQLAGSAAVDALLRGREFGLSLFQHHVREAAGRVADVVTVDARIDGHLVAGPSGDTLSAAKLDSFGNLLIEPGEVVTKGSVTVEVELAT